MALKSVIVTLDGSRVVEQALPHATYVAKGLGLKVTLLRVTPSKQDYYRYAAYLGGMFGDSADQLEAHAYSYLRHVGNRFRQAGIEVAEQVLRGDPASAIIDLALGTAGNLVALTTHGASGIERWLLGSVADRVVRHSGAPVLIKNSAFLPPACCGVLHCPRQVPSHGRGPGRRPDSERRGRA